MRIKQIYNNNVVSSLNQQGEEIVVVSRGLGFQKKVGDLIPQECIEKIFTMHNPKNIDQFSKLIEGISFEHLHISDEIISAAKESIGKRFNENIYITLTDHISYAVERHEQGISIKNALLWEIQRFYAPEYAAGKNAVKIINKRLGISLDNDEAGFIALHFVNAVLDTSMENMDDITSLIRNGINLVKFHFQIEIDQDSLDYSRFITHLRYLGQRVFTNKVFKYNDPELSYIMRSKYPEAYKCAEKIGAYIEKEHSYKISEDDKIFLAVHIHRLTTNLEPTE